MAQKKTKGTKLQVFSGREAKLNRVILQIFERKSPLITYDVWLQLRRIKGFKHTDTKTVYRRVEALNQEDWVTQKGTRSAKAGGESKLYELTLKGKAALRLDETSIEDFLKTATNGQLVQFIELL